MFVFEDIMLVDDKGIQVVLKEIENDELALALKTASPDLRDKIFRNMSERASQLIQEEMEFMARCGSATSKPPSRRSSTSSADWKTPAKSLSPPGRREGTDCIGNSEYRIQNLESESGVVLWWTRRTRFRNVTVRKKDDWGLQTVDCRLRSVAPASFPRRRESRRGT